MRATFTHTVLAVVLLGTALGMAALTTTAQSRRDVTYTPTEKVTFQSTTTFTRVIELSRPTTGASRMKVRFRDTDAVRALPDGRLLSLTGQDMSSIQMVLDTANVQASAALSMPEEKVREIRASYEARTGTVMEDIGGTMWLDGTPDAVEAAVRTMTPKPSGFSDSIISRNRSRSSSGRRREMPCMSLFGTSTR